MDDYETSFLYEWQTAEEDLEFLDYTYCFEVEKPNKRRLTLNGAKQTTAGISNDNSEHDEKKTVLNISLEKLRAIEDPESCLCRSVLINNTLKCIQSGSRVTNEESSKYFSCPLASKRLRLDEMPNNYNTTDILKDSFEDYQEAIIPQEGDTNEKEIGNNQTDKLFTSPGTSLCYSELDTVTRQATKNNRRNCDTIRFSELEFPSVICPLET